jgi:hypothetical protein
VKELGQHIKWAIVNEKVTQKIILNCTKSCRIKKCGKILAA